MIASTHRRSFTLAILTLAALILAVTHADAAHNPFAVGAREGCIDPGGISGWLLSVQTYFYKLISGAVHDAKVDGSAAWALAGISFAYGVFHAAGPGHGKAVVAAYMVANERALRRGLIISLLAALLQGLVAIAIVSAGVFILQATTAKMQSAVEVIEMASYAGVALLGAWLLWRKGRGFAIALRRPAVAADHDHAAPRGHEHRHDHPRPASLGAAAVGDRLHRGHDDGHVHDEHCGHFHAPDPQTLGQDFSWRTAALTIFSAGARPCGGAIVVLVFAHAQQIYAAGMISVVTMALGTAITTGLLAATAVLFKGIAVRLAGQSEGRLELVARGVEVLAALLVLLVGIGLLFGAWGAAACA